jgi:transposase
MKQGENGWEGLKSYFYMYVGCTRRVAQGLGLSESMGYSWRAKRRQTGHSCEDQALQHAEIARLKRENARLEEEVACLNKAATYLCSGYFAKPPK